HTALGDNTQPTASRAHSAAEGTRRRPPYVCVRAGAARALQARSPAAVGVRSHARGGRGRAAARCKRDADQSQAEPPPELSGALRIGTRGSALALAQARAVAEALTAGNELVPIKTSGDGSTAPLGDKSRFVKDIED